MQSKENNQVYAGFFVRLAAYLIDSIIVGIVLTVVVRFPIWVSTLIVPDNIVVRDFIFEYSIKDILIYVLKVLYFIILTYKAGATIGKQALHIRVVSADDGKPTLFEIVYRETVGKFLSALILYAGYFLIGLQKEKRGLHDLMSDTKVVYYHKKDAVVETPVVYQELEQMYTKVNYVEPAENTTSLEIEKQADEEIIEDVVNTEI